MQLEDAAIQLRMFGLYVVSSPEKMRIRGGELAQEQPAYVIGAAIDDPFTLEYKNGIWLAWITAGLYFILIKKSPSLGSVVDAVINYYSLKRVFSEGESQIKSFFLKLEASGIIGEIVASKSIKILCEANSEHGEPPIENNSEIFVEHSDEMWMVRVIRPNEVLEEIPFPRLEDTLMAVQQLYEKHCLEG